MNCGRTIGIRPTILRPLGDVDVLRSHPQLTSGVHEGTRRRRHLPEEARRAQALLEHYGQAEVMLCLSHAGRAIHRQIAAATDLDSVTLQHALDTLGELGHIRIEEAATEHTGGRHRDATYIADTDAFAIALGTVTGGRTSAGVDVLTLFMKTSGG